MAWDKTEPSATADFSGRDDAMRANFAAIEAAKFAATVDSQVTGAIYTPNPVVQIVNTNSGAVNTGTTTLPFDDTIPQITEGDQYMTLAITPKSTTNKLLIIAVGYFASNATANFTMALFQDATANALNAAHHTVGSDSIVPMTLVHYMAAGTTSATTFRIRAGNSASGTTTFNGSSAARKLGGILKSSITIIELYST